MSVQDIGSLTTAASPSPSNEDDTVWFVNFPPPSSNDKESEEALKKCMESVRKYHCFVSAKHKSNTNKMVQDMKETPWLAMQSDHNIRRDIQCNISEFHSELIKSVLSGFVNVSPRSIRELEQILNSLRLVGSRSSGGLQNIAIVVQRYDYIAQIRTVHPSMRIVSFSVTDSINKIDVKKKKTETHIKCAIEYNEYAAEFNMEIWDLASKMIHEALLKSIEAKVNQYTINMTAS